MLKDDLKNRYDPDTHILHNPDDGKDTGRFTTEDTEITEAKAPFFRSPRLCSRQHHL